MMYTLPSKVVNWQKNNDLKWKEKGPPGTDYIWISVDSTAFKRIYYTNNRNSHE